MHSWLRKAWGKVHIIKIRRAVAYGEEERSVTGLGTGTASRAKRIFYFLTGQVVDGYSP